MDREIRSLSVEIDQLRRTLDRLEAERRGYLYTKGGGNAASASLPTGEHQYMVYQMTSDNQAGFDFVRSHPILTE
jgi:hypothetical protein